LHTPGKGAYREAAGWIVSRGNAVALTGAGISVESGIPAFRGSQGMWERYDPMEYATIGAFLGNPEKVWTMLFEMMGILSRSAPNPAHLGLAELERLGLLRSIITQNVDGLHQAAGSRNVIEYHGNPGELVCLSCGNRCSSREIVREGVPPRCDCGAVLKPDIVFFGEPIPPGAAEEAEKEAGRCGVLLVVGTSAQVSPACDIPGIAKAHGARVIEINPEGTFLPRGVTDLHLAAGASDAVTRLLKEVRGRVRPSGQAAGD